MSLQEYITDTDITHVHLKQFVGTPELDGLIAEANDMYEELAISMGLDVPELAFPISILPKLYLRTYVTYRFAEDSIGVNDTITTEDIYLTLYNLSEPKLIELRAKLTYDVLTGEVSGDKGGRTISFGKAVRTC